MKLADTFRAMAKLLTAQADYLDEQVTEPDPIVEPDPIPEPDPTATLMMLEVSEIDVNRYRIKYGFGENRPGRVAWHEKDTPDDVFHSQGEVTATWGEPGREHQQWIDLPDGITAVIYAQTMPISDGDQWETIGEPINVEVAEKKKTDGLIQ